MLEPVNWTGKVLAEQENIVIRLGIIRFFQRASAVGLCFTFATLSPAAAAHRRLPAVTTAVPAIYVGPRRIAVGAIVTDGRVLVPVRGVFEAIGASVSFAAPHFVVVRQDSAVIAAFILGRRHAIVGHQAVELATPPERTNGRVYVPLRIVAQAAGAVVAYASRPRVIRIAPRANEPPAVARIDPVVAEAAREAATSQHAATAQWFTGVAIVTAMCCLCACLLAARRLAPMLPVFLRPKRRSPPIPVAEPGVTPATTPDSVAVSSVQSTGEARFFKQLVTETRTIEVPVTREELVIEYAGQGGTVIIEGRPLNAGETIRIPLWEERVSVDITKHVIVKEDIIIEKRRNTASPPLRAQSQQQLEPT